MSKKCADSCFDTTWGIVISARSQRRQESDPANRSKGNSLINRKKRVKDIGWWIKRSQHQTETDNMKQKSIFKLTGLYEMQKG